MASTGSWLMMVREPVMVRWRGDIVAVGIGARVAAKLRKLVGLCALASVHVHVPAQRLRRAEFALAETARVRSRWPLPACACVFRKRPHFPRIVVAARRQSLAPCVAPGRRLAVPHPRRILWLVMHSYPRRRSMYVLVPRKQQHARPHDPNLRSHLKMKTDTRLLDSAE